MKNFNAETIKKALECCSAIALCGDECPLYDVGCCGRQVTGNALALINSQEQRIKELEAECKKWQSRLEIECEYTKADTVRKMQERLTSFFANDDFVKYNEVDADYINECIDQIAKELLNDAGE